MWPIGIYLKEEEAADVAKQQPGSEAHLDALLDVTSSKWASQSDTRILAKEGQITTQDGVPTLRSVLPFKCKWKRGAAF